MCPDTVKGVDSLRKSHPPAAARRRVWTTYAPFLAVQVVSSSPVLMQKSWLWFSKCWLIELESEQFTCPSPPWSTWQYVKWSSLSLSSESPKEHGWKQGTSVVGGAAKTGTEIGDAFGPRNVARPSARHPSARTAKVNLRMYASSLEIGQPRALSRKAVTPQARRRPNKIGNVVGSANAVRTQSRQSRKLWSSNEETIVPTLKMRRHRHRSQQVEGHQVKTKSVCPRRRDAQYLPRLAIRRTVRSALR